MLLMNKKKGEKAMRREFARVKMSAEDIKKKIKFILTMGKKASYHMMSSTNGRRCRL